MKQSKWKVISKKGKNFENFFISMVALGLAPKIIKKERPDQLITSTWIQTGGNRYFLTAELDQHIKKLNTYLKKNPDHLIKSYKIYQDILNDMERYADKFSDFKYDKLDIIKFLKEYSIYFGKAILYGYNYYFLNQPIADIILDALKRNKSKDTFADFEILSQASKLSVIQKEKRDLLKLVKEIKENKLKKNSKNYFRKIENHLSKYAFMGMHYFRGKPWQKNNITKRINEWLSDPNWQEELKKLNKFAKADILTQKIIKKYKFTPYEKKVVKLMKEMAYATNKFDEVHNYYTYKSQSLIKFINKKIGTTYKELLEINFEELINQIKSGKKVTKAFKKLLDNREKESALIGKRGKVTILAGKKAKEFNKKEIGEKDIKKTDILKGQCACAGQAVGKVVIFKSEKDISKVKKGSIMVAMATVPSFVPAMEKAAGIITEMGGMLSHAAIVSRELGVPCVVGVEGAMKQFKNYDKVEVDATNGIIKKL